MTNLTSPKIDIAKTRKPWFTPDLTPLASVQTEGGDPTALESSDGGPMS